MSLVLRMMVSENWVLRGMQEGGENCIVRSFIIGTVNRYY